MDRLRRHRARLTTESSERSRSRSPHCHGSTSRHSPRHEMSYQLRRHRREQFSDMKTEIYGERYTPRDQRISYNHRRDASILTPDYQCLQYTGRLTADNHTRLDTNRFTRDYNHKRNTNKFKLDDHSLQDANRLTPENRLRLNTNGLPTDGRSRTDTNSFSNHQWDVNQLARDSHCQPDANITYFNYNHRRDTVRLTHGDHFKHDTNKFCIEDHFSRGDTSRLTHCQSEVSDSTLESKINQRMAGMRHHGENPKQGAESGTWTHEIKMTSSEMFRLEHISRLDQMEVYKNSTEYKDYNEAFPKGERGRDRPCTPELSCVSSQDWTASFLQWQEDISNVLSQNQLKPNVVEDDEEVLMRRQKNIDYCKTTEAYDRYIKILPKHKRAKGDPRTPDMFQKHSRRGWDGAIKAWKLRIYRRLDDFD